MKIFGGIHRGRTLVVPKTALRPTTGMLREAVFNMLRQDIDGATFLDLFSGSGAMGLEALSQGARHVTFVDHDKLAIKALTTNLKALKEERRGIFYCQDVFIILEKLAKKGLSFDLIFADPPYGTEKNSLSDKVLKMVDESGLLKEEGSLLLEDAKEASKGILELKTLELKSSRNVGSATLRHYIRKSA